MDSTKEKEETLIVFPEEPSMNLFITTHGKILFQRSRYERPTELQVLERLLQKRPKGACTYTSLEKGEARETCMIQDQMLSETVILHRRSGHGRIFPR
jgi:hypothetical protein